MTEPGEPGISVTVNGEERVLPGEPTVADLVEAEVDSVRGVAVALNASLVPRSTWASTAVADGDRIELLRAAQGG
jgi:sulfur carrier protein